MKKAIIVAVMAIITVPALSWKAPEVIPAPTVHINSIKVHGKEVKFAPNLLNITMTCVQDPNNSSAWDISTNTQWDGHIEGALGENWNADYIECSLSCTYYQPGRGQQTFNFNDNLYYNHTDSSIVTYVYYQHSYDAFPHYYALANPELYSYTPSQY